MRITWNEKEQQFELTFDRSNFQNDLECAKSAGFKTGGPPSWIWSTYKVKALKALQDNKPLSGLTIATDALDVFNNLCIQEQKKINDKKWVDDLKAKALGKPTSDERAQKKAEREKARLESGKEPLKRKPRKARGGQRSVDINNQIKYEVPYVKFVPPSPPSILCVYCKDPVYSAYEKISPLPLCLWCEKTIADTQDE